MTDIATVAERNLCCGCGACAYLQPETIAMVDEVSQGRRPYVRPDADTQVALSACPGLEIRGPEVPDGVIPELLAGWGPVLEVWEGAAADPAIRYAGSSGGVATALAIHCIEAEGLHGVLHAVARRDVPYLNETRLSRRREELVAATGSRYAPASPCEELGLIESSPDPCVFIGKPCDVAGAVQAAERRPALDANLGLTMAIFCAGTPSTAGTLEMIDRVGLRPEQVSSVRYRGNGWPGRATVTRDPPDGRIRDLSYDESWGEILQRHRQWRCLVCADHTGELADLSLGDPWYRDIEPGEPGLSLVLVRTERGRHTLERARSAGAVELHRVGSSILPASQPNLLHSRGATWGRSVSIRAVGLPAPRYPGMSVFATWLRGLSWREKVRSIGGTLRRVRTKQLRRRRVVTPPAGDGETGVPSDRGH